MALFLQATYGAVDLLIVGQFGGDLADVYVSAVSTGSMIMQTLTLVVTGLAMGLTVFVGEKIGAKEPDEAGRIVGSGICFFGGLAVVLTAVMIVAAPALSRLMHAPAEAFDETVSYVVICSAGMVFIVAYNLLGSIFRGIGDSKMPLITVAIACVMNILGDLLLVAVFDMGANGAAIATVFAQAVSVVLSLIILRKRELPFRLRVKEIRPVGCHIKKIWKLGAPIAFQDLLVSISFLVLVAIANSMGTIASAGVGVAQKLCAFVMLVPAAYMQAMSAFVAQNIGAGREDRARRALWCGVASSFAVGIVMAWAGLFHGDILSGIFAEDVNVIVAAWEYLKAYAIDCLFTSFLFCFMGYFNGRGETMFVMVQGFVGAFCVRLPVALVVSRLLPESLFALGLSTPASTLVQIILCGGWYLRQKKKSST